MFWYFLPVKGSLWDPLIDNIIKRQEQQYRSTGKYHLIKAFNKRDFFYFVDMVQFPDLFWRQILCIKFIVFLKLCCQNNDRKHCDQAEQGDKHEASGILKVKIMNQIILEHIIYLL